MNIDSRGLLVIVGTTIVTCQIILYIAGLFLFSSIFGIQLTSLQNQQNSIPQMQEIINNQNKLLHSQYITNMKLNNIINNSKLAQK